MHVTGFAAFVVVWLKGAHTERFGVAVLFTSYLVSSQIYKWRIGDVYWASAVQDVALMTIFGCLTFRTSRWWPITMTALFTLIVLVHLLTITDSGLVEHAAVSAQIGLNTLVNATLLAGAFERWLAGEAPASASAVWGRRQRVA